MVAGFAKDMDKVRRLHALAECVGRIRTPNHLEIRKFKERLEALVGKEKPKIHLMHEIHALTDSRAFSWFAANGICAILPPSCGPERSESRMKVAGSAMDFLLKMVERSPEDASRAARSLHAVGGCSSGHVFQLFEFLNGVAEGDAPLALHFLQSYSCGHRSPSLLGSYTSVISLVLEKGGRKPAREFASLFSEIAAYPETARMFLDSMHFTASTLDVEDWEHVVSSVAEDWRRTLQSDVFFENPPD